MQRAVARDPPPPRVGRSAAAGSGRVVPLSAPRAAPWSSHCWGTWGLVPGSPRWYLAHLRDSPCRSPPACGPGEMGRRAWRQDGFPRPTGSWGVRPCPGCAVAAAVMPLHPFAAPQVPLGSVARAPTQPAPGWYLPRRLPANLLRPVPAPPACPSSPAGGGGGGGSRRPGTALEGACVWDSSFMPGKLRRSRKGVLEEKRWQSLEERGSAGARLGYPVLARSKTCDPSFCKETEQAAVAAGRQGHPSPSLSKRAASYHKAFGELAEREVLLACFSCAWQREVPYHGRLYISSHHVCFHSSLLLKDIKVVVPVTSILALKKTNTALLVPNALSIRTAEGEKFLFVSLRQREATYQLLKSVCKHLQDNGWSPLASPSNKEILRKPLTSSQSDLEQSSPEPDSLQELPDGPSPPPRQAEEEDEEAAALALSSGGPHTTLRARTTTQLSHLNTIILIYLLLMVALLLSSGYIGLRVVELEQQLASVGAWPDLNLSHQYNMT
ncbi:uncharacterized protein M6G45_015195 isoform 2-T2 [Spheniscus humboldti]